MLKATENVASTEDRLAPIALQRWESDGGAVPAWPVSRAKGREN
jgi:hypothetical protein